VLFDGAAGGGDHLAGDGVEGIGRRTECGQEFAVGEQNQ